MGLFHAFVKINKNFVVGLDGLQRSLGTVSSKMASGFSSSENCNYDSHCPKKCIAFEFFSEVNASFLQGDLDIKHNITTRDSISL